MPKTIVIMEVERYDAVHVVHDSIDVVKSSKRYDVTELYSQSYIPAERDYIRLQQPLTVGVMDDVLPKGEYRVLKRTIDTKRTIIEVNLKCVEKEEFKRRFTLVNDAKKGMPTDGEKSALAKVQQDAAKTLLGMGGVTGGVKSNGKFDAGFIKNMWGPDRFNKSGIAERYMGTEGPNGAGGVSIDTETLKGVGKNPCGEMVLGETGLKHIDLDEYMPKPVYTVQGQALIETLTGRRFYRNGNPVNANGDPFCKGFYLDCRECQRCGHMTACYNTTKQQKK